MGNSLKETKDRTQSRATLQSNLQRLREAADRHRGQQLTSLWHHSYNVDHLRAVFFDMKKTAAAGVDGVTWASYAEGLEDNLQDLSARLARGAYRAKPVRRTYIPKADGRLRPLGIPTLEDKLVQGLTRDPVATSHACIVPAVRETSLSAIAIQSWVSATESPTEPPVGGTKVRGIAAVVVSRRYAIGFSKPPASETRTLSAGAARPRPKAPKERVPSVVQSRLSVTGSKPRTFPPKGGRYDGDVSSECDRGTEVLGRGAWQEQLDADPDCEFKEVDTLAVQTSTSDQDVIRVDRDRRAKG